MNDSSINNLISKIQRGIITSMKITYDEKKKVPKADFRYNLITGTGRQSVFGLKEINEVIKGYLESKSGITIRDLEINGIIKFDGEAKDRYGFDYVNNNIIVKRLRRSDLMRLSGRTYDDTTYIGREIPSDKPATPPAPVDKVDSIKPPLKPIKSDLIGVRGVIEQIKKLNPDVELVVSNDDDHDDALLSSIPGNKLILPDGFSYYRGAIFNSFADPAVYANDIWFQVWPLIKTKDDDIKKEDETIKNKPPVNDSPLVNEAKPISNNEVINKIIELNPDVEFAVTRSTDGSDYLLASVPGAILKLPDGYEYKEGNGIISKDPSAINVIIPVLPLIKKMGDDKPKGGTPTPGGDKPKDGTPTKGGDKPKDGATETEEDNNIKGIIKNLKIHNWKNLKRILIGTGIVVAVIALTAPVQDSDSNNYDDSNPDRYRIIQEDDGSIPTNFNTEEEEVIYADPLPEDYEEPYEVPYADPLPEDYEDPYDDGVREVPFEDNYYADPVDYNSSQEVYADQIEETYETQSGNAEAQLDDILAIGYRNIGEMYQFLNGGSLSGNIESCNLEQYASVNDRDAISTILNARNYVIRNAYTDRSVPLTLSDAYRFLDNYVNYAFEGSTVFDGQTIKAYDYLDPKSQYIVTVMGEAMLQLYPGYEYSSPYSNYSYGELVNRVSNEHAETAESFTNGRSY